MKWFEIKDEELVFHCSVGRNECRKLDFGCWNSVKVSSSLGKCSVKMSQLNTWCHWRHYIGQCCRLHLNVFSRLICFIQVVKWISNDDVSVECEIGTWLEMMNRFIAFKLNTYVGISMGHSVHSQRWVKWYPRWYDGIKKKTGIFVIYIFF